MRGPEDAGAKDARGKSMSKLQKVTMWIGIAVAIAAVIQEIRKPKGARDWHGRVGGIVPYEFRPPTVDRVKETYWEPDDDRVLTPTAFGVGWGVNLARVAKLAASARSAA
jgi:hypothetical protein